MLQSRLMLPVRLDRPFELVSLLFASRARVRVRRCVGTLIVLLLIWIALDGDERSVLVFRMLVVTSQGGQE